MIDLHIIVVSCTIKESYYGRLQYITVMLPLGRIKWDASKNHFLGQLNNVIFSNEEKDKFQIKKQQYDKYQLKAKRLARLFFMIGIFCSIAFLTYNLFK